MSNLQLLRFLRFPPLINTEERNAVLSIKGDKVGQSLGEEKSNRLEMGTTMSTLPPSSSESSLVLSFHSKAGWQEHFNTIKETDQLMVIDFSATWCGPCRAMEPVLQQWAAEHTEVVFVKIDVDELKDVAREWSVEAMPTFVLVKKGKEVERIVGARKDELLNKIKIHKSK